MELTAGAESMLRRNRRNWRAARIASVAVGSAGAGAGAGDGVGAGAVGAGIGFAVKEIA